MKEQRLKFGIDTILQPEFGNPGASSPETSSSYTSSPPNSVNTSPTSMAMAGLMASCSSAMQDNRSIYPAWVFCTRYSDRPSAVSGARIRKPRKRDSNSDEEKRPRTAFTTDQLERLKKQFLDNRYLTEKRRQELAHELGLNESQIKIWFQNKRAKLKKSASGERNQMHFK